MRKEKQADNLSEKLLALDENGNSTGKFFDRGYIHDNAIFHNEVALWIINPKTQEVLMQRRSLLKKLKPNKLALCAGHVVGNVTTDQALKEEAKEEIGLDIINYEVKPLLIIKREEKGNKCFSHHFYILQEIPLARFTIQQEELSELIYINYNVLRERMKNGDDEIALQWSPYYEKLFIEFDKIFHN